MKNGLYLSDAEAEVDQRRVFFCSYCISSFVAFPWIMTLIIQFPLPSIVTHFDFSRIYKNISYDFETFISLDRSEHDRYKSVLSNLPSMCRCPCNHICFISALTLSQWYQELWDLLQFCFYSFPYLCRSSKLDISAEYCSENFHFLLFFGRHSLKACLIQLGLSTFGFICKNSLMDVCLEPSIADLPHTMLSTCPYF